MLNAINEVLRIETVLQGFSRVLTEDHAVGGVTLPAGATALVLYGSANRDERQFERSLALRHHPRANAAEHLAARFGCIPPGWQPRPHGDAGAAQALVPRVERFELRRGEAEAQQRAARSRHVHGHGALRRWRSTRLRGPRADRGRRPAKSFGVRVIDDLCFAVEPGEAVGIVGPNGAGKTTLLNLIAGEPRRTRAGSLRGQDITQVRPDVRAEPG